MLRGFIQPDEGLGRSGAGADDPPSVFFLL